LRVARCRWHERKVCTVGGENQRMEWIKIPLPRLLVHHCHDVRGKHCVYIPNSEVHVARDGCGRNTASVGDDGHYAPGELWRLRVKVAKNVRHGRAPIVWVDGTDHIRIDFRHREDGKLARKRWKLMMRDAVH